MSFNFAKDGKTLAIIKGGALDNKKVYLNTGSTDEDNDEYVKSFTKIELPKVSKFQQIPDNTAERQCFYITGTSGSGKSYYAEHLIEQIHKLHKDFPVIVFSPLTDNYEKLNPKRVKIDESLISEPIGVEELSNSIVIFDDIEAIKNKKILKSILSTLTECLFTGRHDNVYALYISHEACKGHETKPILKESHSMTAFPQFGFDATMEYFFKAYWGLNKDEIEYVKNKKSRWCTFFKHYPQVILFEHDCYTRKELAQQAKEYCREIKLRGKLEEKLIMSKMIKNTKEEEPEKPKKIIKKKK